MESIERKASHAGSAAITEADVREAAALNYTPEGVELWMRARLPFLGNRSPLECIEQGDGREAVALMHAVADGAFL